MAITPAASGASSAVQSVWQQVRLQQAQRNADQAEASAQALRQEAIAAERVADRDRETARTLAIQADQAEEAAGRASLGLQALRSTSQMSVQLGRRLDQVAQAEAKSPKVASAKASPVVNVQGQVTGTVVNVTA